MTKFDNKISKKTTIGKIWMFFLTVENRAYWHEFMYCTRAIITHGLYTFYPLFEVHLCTVTIGLMYG